VCSSDLEIRKYQRDAVTNLAPPELEAVHPLGKSPMLELDGRLLIESGAIIQTVLERTGGGRLQPAAGSEDYDRYTMWLHYAEGSAMLPLMLQLYTSRLGEAAAPLKPRIDSEIARHLGFVEQALIGREWLVGDVITGADIQMSFVGEIAKEKNRKYRAKTKQAIKDHDMEKLDNLDKPVRNAWRESF
jgi:glutathione S-transferase